MALKKPTDIASPYFVAGLVWKDRYVVQAAPIVKYMVGWNVEQVTEYTQKKGWKIIAYED